MMNELMKKVATFLGVILAIPAVTGLAWTVNDFRNEVAANTNWRLLQTYQRLELVRTKRKLTHVEWIEWCKAGQQLKIFSRCPPP